MVWAIVAVVLLFAGSFLAAFLEDARIVLGFMAMCFGSCVLGYYWAGVQGAAWMKKHKIGFTKMDGSTWTPAELKRLPRSLVAGNVRVGPEI